jgi:transcription initiation factor TFIID subunit 5
MSVVTPTASSQSPAATSPNQTHDSGSNIPAADRIVIEYLSARGHTQAAKTLREELEAASPDDTSKSSESLNAEDLIKALAVFAQKPTRPGENILKDSSNVLQELTAMGNPVNIQSLIASIGTVGAEELLTLDPTDKHEGFRELEAWVDGSLDMYRVCATTISHLEFDKSLCNSLNLGPSSFQSSVTFIWI